MQKKSSVIYRLLLCFCIMWMEEYLYGRFILNNTESNFYVSAGIAVCVLLLINIPLEGFFNKLFPLSVTFSTSTPIFSSIVVALSFFIMYMFPYYFSWDLFLMVLFSGMFALATTVIALLRMVLIQFFQKKKL